MTLTLRRPRGYKPTREAAMATFAKSWRRRQKTFAQVGKFFQRYVDDGPAALTEKSGGIQKRRCAQVRAIKPSPS